MAVNGREGQEGQEEGEGRSEGGEAQQGGLWHEIPARQRALELTSMGPSPRSQPSLVLLFPAFLIAAIQNTPFVGPGWSPWTSWPAYRTSVSVFTHTEESSAASIAFNIRTILNFITAAAMAPL
eukprot:256608-Rhodomonas_salina.2